MKLSFRMRIALGKGSSPFGPGSQISQANCPTWTIRKKSTIAPEMNIHASGCNGQLVVCGAASSFDRSTAYRCPRAARFCGRRMKRQVNVRNEQTVKNDLGNEQQDPLTVQCVRILIVCVWAGVQEQVSRKMGDQKAAQQ